MTAKAFSNFDARIIAGLNSLGITDPTPPQEKAIEPISSGENVLLIAPTASGKTEAALLPIFDSLLKKGKSEGIEVVYITPLRALNRDIYKRLMFWADWLDMDVQIRHGDTSNYDRRRQLIKPPRILITTPETLQAILPTKSMRKHLKRVTCVIVDEIHELAYSKRGSQLTIGLERLEMLTQKSFQRIGLSATVGNPKEVASFLGGLNSVKIINVDVDKSYNYVLEFPMPTEKDFDFADDLSTTPEAAARLRRILDLIKRSKSTLVFVQGRGQAESLGHKLGKIEPLIEVHHGSISKDQRQAIEDNFKRGKLKGIICTSTLQLGIDIGNVDLCIQYLSPRQVSTLIQRVGRAGHTLSQRSDGILISAYGEDALESLVTAERARKHKLENTEFHIKPLDVLAHQLVGISLDMEDINAGEAFRLVKKAYPFWSLTEDEIKEEIDFLRAVGLLSRKEGLKTSKKARMYYYENLGMMNDERRYPFIDVITDRVIGTVGDEFWTLRARLGLNVILKGRVWRIIQIDEDKGVLQVLPSEDPLGALPGWDGELISVPLDVAQGVGDLREKIAIEVEHLGSLDKAVNTLSERYCAEKSAIRAAANEIESHIKAGFSLPSKNRLLIEGYDKFIVFHLDYGEKVNRTLGAIFDSILSEHDLIYSWWNDPYRILIEAPRKIDRFDLEKVEGLLFKITEEEADKYLDDFMEARFPFAYRMKFIAERFGVIPKGKTLNSETLENLYLRFKNTPVYKETLREIHQEKLDIRSAKKFLAKVNSGNIEIIRTLVKSPSPLARHILEQYADVAELMEKQITATDQLDYMKMSIMSRQVHLACMNCGKWHASFRVRDINEKPLCENCGSGLLAVLKRYQNSLAFIEQYQRILENDELVEKDMDGLIKGRKTADMVLSYGRKAIEALMVTGVGPITSYQILSRMHRSESEFYADLLKAKIQYMRTRQYWNDR
jgi:ATP-dependent Lhr-like helicase